MDITIVKLDAEHTALIDDINGSMSVIQSDLDLVMAEYHEAVNKVNEIKSRILPIKIKLSPLAELKSGVASRKSRIKYFPEFATRNFNDSKDNEYLEYVRSQLNG